MDPAPPLAFWTDEDMVYAAFDVQGALELANAEYGYAGFTLEDMIPCDSAVLDGPAYSPAGERLGTLWQQMALLCAPGYLCASSP